MRTVHAALLLLAWLTGWAFGQPVIFLLLAAIGLLLWQLGKEKALLQWMRSNSRLPPNDLPPVLEEISAIALRRAEKSRRRKRRYQESLKHFHELSQAMPDPTFIVDQEGHLLNFNKAAREVFALNPRLDMGAKIQHLIRNEAFARFWQSDVQGVPVLFAVENGETRWTEWTKVRLSRGNVLLVARDVTRIVLLDLKRKAFVDNASHELKTPITVLAGFLEWMAQDEVPERWALPLSQMREHAGRMQDLVQDMLMLAGLERPGYPLQRQALFLPTLLSQVAAGCEAPGAAHIRCEAQDITAMLDEKLIRSALENLVVNAQKHAAAANIVLFATTEDDALRLGVRDDGRGIAGHHLPRLTERFYRVDGQRGEHTGSGLGLAIVKHVAEVHGGYLQIASQPGSGSEFALCLPQEKQADNNS